MKKKLFAGLVTGLFLVGMSYVSQATPLIDTTGSWDGVTFVRPFGEDWAATYGQTFTVTGSETVLTSFTFFIDDELFLYPDFVDFEAYVYAWDGSKATGSALYSSSPMSTTNNGGSDGYETFTINTGGVNLSSGSQYIAFFSASNQFDGILGTSRWSFIGPLQPSAYSGGQFVWSNNGNNFGSLFTNNWDYFDIGNRGDLAFTMTFEPVPEPATMLLLGTGLVGLAAARRRRKKNQA